MLSHVSGTTKRNVDRQTPWGCSGCSLLSCGIYCSTRTQFFNLQQPAASIWCNVSFCFRNYKWADRRYKTSRSKGWIYLRATYLGLWNELPSPYSLWQANDYDKLTRKTLEKRAISCSNTCHNYLPNDLSQSIKLSFDVQSVVDGSSSFVNGLESSSFSRALRFVTTLVFE